MYNFLITFLSFFTIIVCFAFIVGLINRFTNSSSKGTDSKRDAVDVYLQQQKDKNNAQEPELIKKMIASGSINKPFLTRDMIQIEGSTLTINDAKNLFKMWVLLTGYFDENDEHFKLEFKEHLVYFLEELKNNDNMLKEEVSSEKEYLKAEIQEKRDEISDLKDEIKSTKDKEEKEEFRHEIGMLYQEIDDLKAECEKNIAELYDRYSRINFSIDYLNSIVHGHDWRKKYTESVVDNSTPRGII